MSKNKTVLMIAYYFPPAAGIGTFRITKFSKYLRKLGYNPIIISPREEYYSNKDDSILCDLKGIPRYNLEIVGCNSNNEKNFYNTLKVNLDKIIKETNPQYAFITGGPFYYLKIDKLLYKKYGIKCVVDFRDPWSLQKAIEGNLLRKIKNKVYKKIVKYNEKIIFKYASWITMVNDTMKDSYSSLFPNYNNKIVTLPNAVDIEDYEKGKPYVFKDKVILYTGKFNTSSGFRDPTNFLLALKKINENKREKIRFIHVGHKDKIVEKIVIENHCEDFVDFYGNCSYRETISYCKGADILLILSTKEKSEQTGKIYDYLGCNRKILAVTNRSNEIFKICDKCGILVSNPSNIDDIGRDVQMLFKQKKISYDTSCLDTREKMTEDLIKLLCCIEKGNIDD